MTSIETLHFDNHFARLGSQFSSPLPPTPLPEPYLVSANPDVAALIDLDRPVVRARYEYADSETPGLAAELDRFLARRAAA